MDITTRGFKEEVLNSDIPVLLECWASWCLPCKQVDPTLQRLAKEHEGECKVLKINIDRNPSISKEYNVKGLPAFMLFVDGEEKNRLVGAQSDESLIELIQEGIECQNSDEAAEEGETSDEEQKIIEERLRQLGYL